MTFTQIRIGRGPTPALKLSVKRLQPLHHHSAKVQPTINTTKLLYNKNSPQTQQKLPPHFLYLRICSKKVQNPFK
jgi:hypothetical protein